MVSVHKTIVTSKKSQIFGRGIRIIRLCFFISEVSV